MAIHMHAVTKEVDFTSALLEYIAKHHIKTSVCLQHNLINE